MYSWYTNLLTISAILHYFERKVIVIDSMFVVFKTLLKSMHRWRFPLTKKSAIHFCRDIGSCYELALEIRGFER
jgi:hypothetical protein